MTRNRLLARQYPTPMQRERNRTLMIWREQQRRAAHRLMMAVNGDWFDRMWQTPDVAMCLGRHDHLEPIGEGSWRAWPPTTE